MLSRLLELSVIEGMAVLYGGDELIWLKSSGSSISFVLIMNQF